MASIARLRPNLPARPVPANSNLELRQKMARLKSVTLPPAIIEKHEPSVVVLPPRVERRRFDLLHAITITIAILMAAIAAYFSVSGMARIFPGAVLFGVPGLAAMIMAALMEGGKLAGAAWLSRYWTAMGFFLRLTLALLVIVLAVINALGVFGQLSSAHLGPHVRAVAVTEQDAATNGARIDSQSRLVADLNRQIAQIDGAIEEATKRGRSTAAMDLAKDQRRNRADLVEQRTKEDGTLRELRTTQARITGDRQMAEAEVGVLEYAATLFGIDREQMIQLLILAMVMSCDPLSITLVIATAASKRKRTI